MVSSPILQSKVTILWRPLGKRVTATISRVRWQRLHGL